MGKLGMALFPIIMAGVIAATFGVMMFLIVWHSSDRWTPHESISVGGAVVVAGCGGAR
jgi:hypothetical protein